MTQPIDRPASGAERRDPTDAITPSGTRGRTRLWWDLVFNFIRFLAKRAKNVYAVFGIFLLTGAAIAVVGTWAFTELAGNVRSGNTQAFDDAVMRWIGAHQNKTLTAAALEITSLGTATVVTMIVLIAGMFLWLNRHKHSAILLGVATVGGLALNMLLKTGFNRPRPKLFEWSTTVFSSSFPSGHSMSAVIVYSTVAYLAGRLQANRRSRWLTFAVTVIIVTLICASRMYLGVHYPSDVLAGIVIGLAWAGFCMAVLEATQLWAKRHAPQMLADEQPAPPAQEPAPVTLVGT